ncbi:MAG: hypothetical protein MMC33_005882 [Icmadophila ericetorum]|nr:hypothetical protein [Icmadophila ericetorum]
MPRRAREDREEEEDSTVAQISSPADRIVAGLSRVKPISLIKQLASNISINVAIEQQLAIHDNLCKKAQSNTEKTFQEQQNVDSDGGSRTSTGWWIRRKWSLLLKEDCCLDYVWETLVALANAAIYLGDVEELHGSERDNDYFHDQLDQMMYNTCIAEYADKSKSCKGRQHAILKLYAGMQLVEDEPAESWDRRYRLTMDYFEHVKCNKHKPQYDGFPYRPAARKSGCGGAPRRILPPPEVTNPETSRAYQKARDRGDYYG